MKTLCLLFFAAIWARGAVALHGTITDPSGAAVPGATIRLHGPGGTRRTTSGIGGNYAFDGIEPGKYDVRITSRGFAAVERAGLIVQRTTEFDARLAIQPGREAITVNEEGGAVGTSPFANGGALHIGQRQIAALSDDPDELALQLQALAGPAPGPNGGQLYIDGFTGSNVPAKSSIREVRVNSNPFSPEYDRPGFARIDIYTKPGSDTLHGQAFVQFNDRLLNSRNPLLTESARSPYRVWLYGIDTGGPIERGRASFTVTAERRQIGENAFILATTPAGSINQALPAPQVRTSVAPRFDLALTPSNTLTARYQELRVDYDNQGAGDFNLATRAYRERETDRTAQITETAVLNPRAINETRFQYSRSATAMSGALAAPAITVVGAFSGGGQPEGDSGKILPNWELTNVTTVVRGSHTLKWGGRLRQAAIDDTSFNNFLGTFTFYSLDQFLAGTPALFSLSAGTPTTRVSTVDAALFIGDDWRISKALTASLGLRYEGQTRLGDRADAAPRVGIAWNVAHRIILRAGAGVFYDRLSVDPLLNSARYDGITQQSYVIFSPTFYPVIPPLAELRAESQPEILRPLYGGLRAGRLYQTTVSIERQLDAGSRVTLSWIENRGLHLPDSRNINTPIRGAYPFGDSSVRLLTEDAGRSRVRQFVANVNVNRKAFTIFGYYALSYGKDNAEGQPADPYNLRAEWGPSSYGDIRHRGVFGGSAALPGKVSVSPFFVVNTGVPYNITTGLDPLDTGFPAARPAFIGPPGCIARSCFDFDPPPGAPIISRNSGRSSGAVNLGLRASRTWSLGGERASGTAATATEHGPMGRMAAPSSGRRYNLIVSASTLNALNIANLGPPNGDLSSPYFGQPRALGGLIVMNHGGGSSTYNRKIDLQLRFTF